MNIKSIIITAVTIIISAHVYAQKDFVRLIISGKTVGEISISNNPAVVKVNKIKYKKIADVTVIIKQSLANQVYKRSLQITDENENQLLEVNEQRSKAGVYKINLAKTRQQLLKQNIIKVYLTENPVNDMMSLPSGRNLLAEIHLR